MADEATGFATFAEKWLHDNPEQAIVAVFLPSGESRTTRAFGTLVHELEHAVFAAREPQAAIAKLAWWKQELAGMSTGAARHPVTRELFEAAPESVGCIPWPEMADAAIELVEPRPPASLAAALDRLGAFYRPVCSADAILRGAPAHDAAPVLWSGSRLLRSVRGTDAGSDSALLPLDLLARHGLTRGSLQQPSPQRAALLVDFVVALDAKIRRALQDAPLAGAAQRVRSRLDLLLIRRAARAPDPARVLAAREFHRWRALWFAWREAAAHSRSLQTDRA